MHLAPSSPLPPPPPPPPPSSFAYSRSTNTIVYRRLRRRRDRRKHREPVRSSATGAGYRSLRGREMSTTRGSRRSRPSLHVLDGQGRQKAADVGYSRRRLHPRSLRAPSGWLLARRTQRL